MKRAERLQKAANMTGLLQEVFHWDGDESEAYLADLWDSMTEWLVAHKKKWAPRYEVGDLSFDSLVELMKTQPGGKYLKYRFLRSEETSKGIQAERYVVTDGSADFAEIVVNRETRFIMWIMVYHSQNLVHLIQAATKHGVELIS